MLLDFGLAKDFPPAFRDGIVRLTFAILTNDQIATDLAPSPSWASALATVRPTRWSRCPRRSSAARSKAKKAYADKELIEQFSEDLPQQLQKNPVVEVPGDVLLVSRVMGLLTGLGKSLDSQVDLFSTIMPYAQQLMMAQAVAPIAPAAN